MTHYDVFNGDADGLCSLHQLRLTEPRNSELITGVKRDIDLVKQVDVAAADSVTILDVSLEKNRQAVQALLDAGVTIQYFDHHFPGDVPEQSGFEAHIDTNATTCTGLIVNRYLDGACLPWAVTAAFGDNLITSAREAAAPLALAPQALAQLEELGTLLNYNGYGATVDDLFFPPAKLYARLAPYRDPFTFIAEDPAFVRLRDGYAADMQSAGAIAPEHADASTALLILPNASFARRISGVLSNQLAREHPDRAHALLCELADNHYLVSVRAPLNRCSGADELCRQFATGGGRRAAAGINRLPAGELDAFADAFRRQYAA